MDLAIIFFSRYPNFVKKTFHCNILDLLKKIYYLDQHIWIKLRPIWKCNETICKNCKICLAPYGSSINCKAILIFCGESVGNYVIVMMNRKYDTIKMSSRQKLT